MFMKSGVWEEYVGKVKDFTKREMGPIWKVFYIGICPVCLSGLLGLSVLTFDLMDTPNTKPYPEGSGLYPFWSCLAGWFLGLVPVAGFIVWLALSAGTSTAPPGGVA